MAYSAKRPEKNPSAADARDSIWGWQEAYYVDHQTYTSTANLTGDYGVGTSDNVTLGTAGGADDYTITSFHSSGDKTYSVSGPGGTIATM